MKCMKLSSCLCAQVAITANNVKRLQMFEDDQPGCAVVALHSPDDPAQGLGLLYSYTSVDTCAETNAFSTVF